MSESVLLYERSLLGAIRRGGLCRAYSTAGRKAFDTASEHDLLGNRHAAERGYCTSNGGRRRYSMVTLFAFSDGNYAIGPSHICRLTQDTMNGIEETLTVDWLYECFICA